MRVVNIYEKDYESEKMILVSEGTKVYDDVEEFISALKEGDTVYSTHSFEGDGLIYTCGDLPTYEYVTQSELKEKIEKNFPDSEYVEKYGFKRNAEAIRKAVKAHPTIELSVARFNNAEHEELIDEFFFTKGEPNELAWWFGM